MITNDNSMVMPVAPAGFGGGFGGVGAGHAFDFSFNLGVRYTF